MQSRIKHIIDSVVPISSKSLDKITDLIHLVTLEKGKEFVQIGQRNNLEYFVLEGICKSFLHNPKGEEMTLSFFMPNTILSPSTTRNKDGKSILNFVALTPLEVATIDATAFEQLMIEDLEIRQFGNTVLRNELMDKVQKEIGLASLPGKERLQIMRKKYHNIENLIPHSDIASYLGITTISLSRIRASS